MSALESLINARGITFGNAHPSTVTLITSTLATRSFRGTDRDLCLTPAICTALGILESWDADSDIDHATRVGMACGQAVRVVLAAVERDRSSQDSMINATPVDPTDRTNDVLFESARPGVSVTGDYSLEAAQVTRPDMITRTTDQDRLADALDAAMDLGADSRLINAIASPAHGTERQREGDTPILRAAGMATAGRKLAANKKLLWETRGSLRESGRYIAAHESITRVRATWDEQSSLISAAQVDRGRGVESSGWDLINFSVETFTPAAWVAPSLESSEQISGNVRPVQPRMLGIKVPSRRSGKRGSTGPTIPEQLRRTPEAVFVLSDTADRADLRALISRTR